MKTKRKLFLCAALALVLLASLFSIGRSHYGAVNAEENTEGVFLKISSTNLSFDDNIYIYFRAYYDGIDVSDASPDNYGMIFWKTEVAEEERTFENAQTLAASGSAIIIEKCDDWQNLPINAQGDKKNVATYKYKVAAKEMADVIYAEPYALKGGVYYYGKTIEYSVAAYASRRLGFYHGIAGSTNENFINLLNAMVNYGTLAQKYFNYNVDNLMSDVVSAGKHATLTHIEALAPTCTEAGHAEYWKCECGQLFADADGKTTLEAIPTLDPLGHDYISGICSRCEDIELTDTKFFTFTLLSDDTYSVKANDTYKSTLPKGVKVPSYYNNKPVTAISHAAFKNCNDLKIFISPDYVTKIQDHAFDDCSSLIRITIPDNVTKIGEFAFYNCSSLTSITMSDSITSIGVSAFYGCTNLTNITIPDSVTSLGGGAFSNCKKMTNITVPDGVTNIGDSLFSGCSSLTSVTIGNSVTSIGASAFYGCSNLTSVTIPDNATSISANAFYNCSNLENITILGNITNIGYSAFYNCSSLTNITIPDSVTSIGSNAFSNCSSLISIAIPSSVTNTGNYIFSGCKNLTSVIIPNGVTSIANYTFSGCSSLESITIPNSITSIGTSAFYNCNKLTSITISDSVTSIENYAFSGCSSLTSVNYLGNIESWCIINFAEYNSNPLSFAHKLLINGDEIKDINIPKTITQINNYAFYGCNSLTSITIPESVTSIGNYAFYNCSNLTSATILGGNIGRQAFESCSELKTITLGSNVTSIGNQAFFNCINLTNFTIPDSVTSIGSQAFYNCQSLTSIILPDSITSIADFTFSNCSNLVSITIPNSVTSIIGRPLYYCTQLKRIDFKGTMSEWKAITKKSDWNYRAWSYIIYCTDGKLDKNDNEITD